MSKEEKRSTHMLHTEDDLGEVQIADEVVATIAGLAAMEVEGVASMAGNQTKELMGKLGSRNPTKGVKIVVDDRNVSVDLALNIDFGCSIVDVSGKVQEKVKGAIENMTGLCVSCVNVHIVSVDMGAEK